MSEECECPKCPDGLPEWLATFADLMSLLMCFFVLLLSFSVIDAQKYKQIAGSMRMAFGVQRDVEVQEPPKGTSIVMQEFSPSIPEPTPLNIVRQNTEDTIRENLKVNEKDSLSEEDIEKIEQQKMQEVMEHAGKIKDALEEQIDKGLIDVETEEMKIIIRINEKGSFPSGTAKLKPGFVEVIDQIADVIGQEKGPIVVAGHTDDIPISTAQYRSNWELSSARAVTVAHELIETDLIEESRVMVEGHADKQPLVENDSWENRARNRRVEIILLKGQDEEGEEIDVQ